VRSDTIILGIFDILARFRHFPGKAIRFDLQLFC
jgi:hypothetical protein